MEKIDKIKSMALLHNSLQEYEYYLTSSIYKTSKLEKNFMPEYIKYAALSMVILNIILLKEDIIENNGGKIYTSKIYENNLESCIKFIAEPTKDKKYRIGNYIDDAPSMFAAIRNKLAHGDFKVEDDNLIINKEEGDLVININKFIGMFNDLNDNLFYAKKNNEYQKKFVCNIANNVINGPLTNEKEIEDFIKTNHEVIYTLKSIDNKEIPYEIKTEFLMFLEINKNKIQKVNDNKQLFQPFIDYLYEKGYVLSIENKKIKNKETIKKIKESILLDKDYVQRMDINILTYYYGEIINKILIDESSDKTGIITATRINTAILKGLILAGEDKSIEYLKKNNLISDDTFNYVLTFEKELFASICLAQFTNTYLYGLDKVYKNTKEYRLDREDFLNFGYLDLSELKPTICIVEEKGKIDAQEKLESAMKKRNEMENSINKDKNNIIGLENKTNKTNKEIIVLENLKSRVKTKEIELSILEEKVNEQVAYLYEVIKDYENNHEYFYNLAIIEGIRNSISHGNVQIINNYSIHNVYDTKIKFTNIYKGKVYFELTASIYDLNLLFDVYNSHILNRFNKKTKQKIKE